MDDVTTKVKTRFITKVFTNFQRQNRMLEPRVSKNLLDRISCILILIEHVLEQVVEFGIREIGKRQL
jgi:hypothetical protein